MGKGQSVIGFTILLIFSFACVPQSSRSSPTPKIIYPVGYSTDTPRPTYPPPTDPTPTAISTDPNFPQSFIENASVLCQESFSREVLSMAAEGPAYIMTIDSSYSLNVWEPADEDLRLPLMEADSAEDVLTLICVKESESKAGTYTDGSAAFRKYLDVRLVRTEDGQVIGQKSFTGGSPPATKSSGESGTGTLPIFEYRAWLLSLFSNEYLFVDYPPVLNLVFSPDAKFLAMVGGDISLKIWGVSEQKVVFSNSGFAYRSSEPVPLAFSSDSKWLAVRDRSTVSILNTQTWELVSQLASNEIVYSVSFSSHNQLIAVGTYLGVKVFQMQDMREIFQYTTFGRVSHVSLTPDDKYLIAGVYSCDYCGSDKGLYILDLISGDLHASLEDSIIKDVALLADGRTLALAIAEDKRIWLFDIETASGIGYLDGHTSTVEQMSLSSDGKWMISIDQENEMIVWDMQKLQLFKILPGIEYDVSAIALSRDGNLLAVGSLEDGVVNFQELK